MDEPLFLTVDEVLRLHDYQITHFGGEPAVLDVGLLESAISQPSATWEGKFLHEDIAAMAAAYLYHIVKNHPFADGNKRTGTHAAIAFLGMNDIEVDYPNGRGGSVDCRRCAGAGVEGPSDTILPPPDQRRLMPQTCGSAPIHGAEVLFRFRRVASVPSRGLAGRTRVIRVRG